MRGGFREGEEEGATDSVQGGASRSFSLEAESLMDLDMVNPKLDLNNQTALGLLGRFGALAYDDTAAGPPSSSSSRAVNAPAEDPGSRLNSFMNKVSDLRNMVLASSLAGTQGGVLGYWPVTVVITCLLRW